MKRPKFARRHFVKSSAALFGFSFSLPMVRDVTDITKNNQNDGLFYRYPAIQDEFTYAVVQAAHFDFEKVKALVKTRPELANAAWDWGYGDFETALGAASHMGRRDIAELLLEYGARPDIFTFALLGMLKSLEEIIETIPGIQSRRGPHGITLLKHAKNRVEQESITPSDKRQVQKVINYLEKLGNADIGAPSLALSDGDKKKFLGDYRFGHGETEIFNVGPYSFDPEKYIRITRRGLPGRLLHKIDENSFSPTGAPSVKIIFDQVNDKIISLTIHEPEPLIKVVRI